MTALQQREVGTLAVRYIRVMPGDDVIGQLPNALGIAAGREVLEGSDPDVAGGDAGEDSTGQRRLAQYAFAGQHRGERSRGRDSQHRHRLADDVFAQHRTERRAAVAPARKRRRARPLELDVAADAVGVDHLAEQDRAAVTQLRHEMAKLVTGIGHGDRVGAVGQALAGEDFRAFRAFQPVRIEPELERQRPVQFYQPGRDDRGRRNAGEKVRRQRRIGVLEGEMHRHGLKIGMWWKLTIGLPQHRRLGDVVLPSLFAGLPPF